MGLNRDRMLEGKPFYNDSDLLSERKLAKAVLEEFNRLPERDGRRQKQILSGLLGSIGEKCHVMQPFTCDYGSNIRIGDRTFLNYDVLILDGAPVTIGNDVLIGPRVCIYTAAHPIDPDVRSTELLQAAPVRICDKVWIGGSAVINPGVTVGEGSIVGSGSVVTRDVPPYVVAAGNPCRVIRQITDEDKAAWQQAERELKSAHERFGAGA